LAIVCTLDEQQALSIVEYEGYRRDEDERAVADLSAQVLDIAHVAMIATRGRGFASTNAEVMSQCHRV